MEWILLIPLLALIIFLVFATAPSSGSSKTPRREYDEPLVPHIWGQ